MKNPNAHVGGATAAVPAIVATVLVAVGIHVDARLIGWISAAVVWCVLFIGREGVKGAVDRVWKGKRGTAGRSDGNG